ncbi:hypothetical protein BGZ72_003774 [Mortierella alpina]|nr:hypothetical protein BGZ72_003774 [Mortierella alpina]
MNLKKGPSNLFEIPELCSFIASYLNPHDFTQLCLVCKDFSQLFRPYLWRKVVLKGHTSYRASQLPWIQALKSNGHFVEHAELFSWHSDESEASDFKSEDAMLENEDYVLARTLLAHCGSKLTSLKVVDRSINGRIWDVVLERIGNNKRLEGGRPLDRIQVLDISLTCRTTDSNFQSFFTRPHEYPEVVAVFAGVTELRLEELRLPEDYDESRMREDFYDEMEPLAIHFRDLVKLFPNLCKLTLENIDIAEPQYSAETGTFQSAAAVTTNKPLNDYQFHTLDLHNCGISSKHIIQILERSCNVRSLKIGLGTALLGDVEVLVNSLPTLTPLLTEYGQLDVGHSFSGFSTILRGLPFLSHLTLCNTVQDDELQILAESCPLLVQLYLFNCKSLTNRGLKHILRSSTRLESLRLSSTPMSWNIFEQDSASSSTSEPSTTTATTPTLPATCIPWACQHTLLELDLQLLPDKTSTLVDTARQTFQSFTKLRHLYLWCDQFPSSALLDHSDEDLASGQPSILYRALETLDVRSFYPTMQVHEWVKMRMSMPNLTKVAYPGLMPLTRFSVEGVVLTHNRTRPILWL